MRWSKDLVESDPSADGEVLPESDLRAKVIPYINSTSSFEQHETVWQVDVLKVLPESDLRAKVIPSINSTSRFEQHETVWQVDVLKVLPESGLKAKLPCKTSAHLNTVCLSLTKLHSGS